MYFFFEVSLALCFASLLKRMMVSFWYLVDVLEQSPMQRVARAPGALGIVGSFCAGPDRPGNAVGPSETTVTWK